MQINFDNTFSPMKASLCVCALMVAFFLGGAQVSTADGLDSGGGSLSDSINVFSNSSAESEDTDADGLPDNVDPFPQDSTNNQDGNWVHCANEWSTCSLPVQALVRYGANGIYFFQMATESIRCSNNAFGNPVNVVKQCEYLLSTINDFDGDGVADSADAFPSDPAENADADGDGFGDNSDPFPNDATNNVDGSWVHCAYEWFTCTLPSSALVRYGASGVYFFKEAVDSIRCTNNAFGNPISGVKTCEYLLSVTDDSDGDGVVDSVDSFPRDPSESADSDGDGFGDNSDPFPQDSTNNQNGNWIHCANEWSTCSLPAQALVRYGANGIYFFQVVTDSIRCTNNVFGNPINVVKHCEYLLSATNDSDGDGVADSADVFPNDPAENADADGDGFGDNSDPFPQDSTNNQNGNWIHCANEWSTCMLPSPALVRYGASGVYIFQEAVDSIRCTDNAFGNPINSVKECEYLLSATDDFDGDGVVDSVDIFPSDAAESADSDGDGFGDNSDPFPQDSTNNQNGNWIHCANEWSTCSLPAAALVRYGANGVYAFKAATDSIRCTNNSFGNPINVVKSCDYLLSIEDVFVSDLPWLSEVNGWGPAERDTSNGGNVAGDGNPIQLNGVVYEKGIGTNAYSQIDIDLNGQYTRFRSNIGLDDERVEGHCGSVQFELDADGTNVFTSEGFVATTPTGSVDIDVTNVSVLTLKVTDNGDGICGDHGDWANARLIGSSTAVHDSDGDGISDFYELQLGTDPNDANDTPADLDVDGIPDSVDSDRDGDGVINSEDAFPNDATETTDTDGDGVGDNADPEPNNPDVTGLNTAPVALDDVATIDQGSLNNSIAVLANDSDADNDIFTITTATATSGTVSIEGDELSYSSAIGFVGEDTIDYTITDTEGASASAQVTVTVTVSAGMTLANKTSGVAPLSVHFDSGSEGDDFHNLRYDWDFGDPESGHWVGVEDTVGLSRNVDTGPVSGHLYARPGTYTATLTVSDESGVIESLSQEVTITVTDPDDVFSGTATKCVSKSGDFAGCPSGAEHIIWDDSAFSAQISSLLNNNASEPKRVLLRRGDQWNIAYENENPQLRDDIYLAAYGECLTPNARNICSNAPILSNTQEGGVLTFFSLSENITIQDIHLTASDRRYGSIRGISTRDVTIYRLKLTVSGGLGNAEHRNFALIDSDITGGHTILVFAGGRNLRFQGNHIHDSYSGHLLRVPSAFRSVIAHNVIHSTEVDPQRLSRGSTILKLHSLRTDYLTRLPHTYVTLGIEPTFTEYVYVANNFFGKAGPWPVAVDPQNSVNDELVSHVILEKNFHSCAYGNSATIGTLDSVPSNACSRLLSIQGANITVRNSVFDLQDAGVRYPDNRINYPAAIAVSRFAAVTAAAAPTNVNVYHNTIRIPTDEVYFNDSPHWIDVGVDATNTRIANNLINKPNPAATSYLRDRSGSAVATNNLFVDDAGFVDGFNSNVLDRNYRLREDSPAIGAGTPVSILDDYANTLRNGVYDVGAYVYAGIQEPVDTDGDGINDDYERQLGTDPNDANDTPADLDVDGIPDSVDSDRDGDGVIDNADAFPNDATETTDTDGDGVGDNTDPEPNNPDVTGLNTAPLALDDIAMVNQDSFNNSLVVLVNDSDADNDIFTITAATATSGTVSIEGDELLYSPAIGFVGEDTVGYTITDTEGASASAQVTIIVTNASQIIANRTSGIAPLSVHFDSGYESDNFHDYQFTWDFGDSNSGVNAYNGFAKNNDTGPISGHLYEQAGNYAVTLTVRDASGIVETKTAQITVTDQDLAYPDTQTKCISKSGDFGGCPVGAEQLTYSDAQLDANMYTLLNVDHTRVLLHRGEQWDLEGLRAGQLRDVYIGAYGSCESPDSRGICSNAPILNNVGAAAPNILWFRHGSRNITIEDIHFTAPDRFAGAVINVFTLQNLTLNRIKGTTAAVITGQGMHNSGVYNSDLSGGIITFFVDGQYMIFKNNTFRESATSHVVRFTIARKLVFTHNDVHSPSVIEPGRTGVGLLVKLHSLHEGDLCDPVDGTTVWCSRFVTGANTGGIPEPRYSTEYVYMANNLFGRGSNWGVDLMASNGRYAERLSNVIVEKNRWDLTHGSLEANLGSQSIQLQMQATGGTIRNNIIDIAGLTNEEPGDGYNWPIRIANWNSHFPADGINIHNNTINTAGQDFSSPWAGIRVEANQRNVDVRNNLIVSPTNNSDDVAVSDLGVNTTQSNNLYTDNPGFVDDTSSIPRNRNLHLSDLSPAIGAGTPVSVLDDYENTLRNGVYDVGAYVYAGIQEPVDTDGDGINDDYELQLGTDPNDASDTPADLDADGIPDGVDNDRDGDGVINSDDGYPDDVTRSVRTSQHEHHDDVNPHDPSSALHGEHTAVLELVRHIDTTHVAINSGDWFDTATWEYDVIPDDNARVVIARDVRVNYAGMSDARLLTVRVDGELTFATDVSSQMVVDTLVVDPGGVLTVGTVENPVLPNVNVDIVIADNGNIDVAWDPSHLSRGVVAHGRTRMHGHEKTTHLKVAIDPVAGDTIITLSEAPVGWQTGDTIVLAGTRYDGYKWDNSIRDSRFYEPEDEVLTIASINGAVIHVDRALTYNHDTPRADLKTSVANYTRNVTIKSEHGADSLRHHRGHVMFMHSDNVDVRYTAFHELGRTDKSQTALNVSEFDNITPDSNVKGRYSMHFHRTGVNDVRNPGIAEGNAVFGAPGWGYVHHDSNVLMHDNASYNTFGAGFVAETGNEIGTWSNNIAIFAKGIAWTSPKNGNDTPNFDMGKTGSGFYFQGRMVEAFDNIAASTNSGFTYFHRGRYADNSPGLDGNIRFDAAIFSLPEALDGWNQVGTDDAPILNFKGNEAFSSNYGFFVEKANTSQGHDVRTVLSDFTAWSVVTGAHLAYTSHYLVDDFDVVGIEAQPFRSPRIGIELGRNASDITLVNNKVDGFQTCIFISDIFVGSSIVERFDLKQHAAIDSALSGCEQDYNDYNPQTFEILSSAQLVPGRFTIAHPAPLTLNFTDRRVSMRPLKTDSLGSIALPAGIDDYDFEFRQTIRHGEEQGYYTFNGKNYFIIEDYYSDRVTGEIHKFGEFVELNDDLRLGNQYSSYRGAKNNGEVNPDSAAPVAINDNAVTSMEVDVTFDLLANDSDPDADTIRVDGIVQPIYGQVFDNGDGTITYQPGFEYTGTESFKYWVTDGNGHFSPAEVTVTVNP